VSEPTRDPERSDEEPTRREWLLRLGGLTALAGVAGLVPDAVDVLSVAQAGPTGLPPGLYEPSSEHLNHVLSARDAPVVPRGTETDYVTARTGPFRPRFFSASELRTVTRVVEIVLGSVDPRALSEAIDWLDLRLHEDAAVRQAARALDPLHRALAIAYSGEARVIELETSDAQALVRAGLQQLDARSRQQSGKDFLQLAGNEQVNLLLEISRAPQQTPLGQAFSWLRRETIRGYFTSQAGLKELDYKGNAFHGTCPGCNRTPA
jgi:hypothetical protein